MSLVSRVRFVVAAGLRSCVCVALVLGFASAQEAGSTMKDKYALDADRLHFAEVEWATPLRHQDRNRFEFEAYNDTILHARQFPAAELIAAGRRDIGVLDLLNRNVGRDYQYKLITMEGRLLRARRLEPNKPLAAAGVTGFYECWLFPTKRSEPVCFVCLDLPEGLAPKLLYEPSLRVVAAGYYFKPMAYESEAADPKNVAKSKVEVAPLLIGRGFQVVPEPVVDTSKEWREGFFPGLTALIGTIIAFALGLTWWFRRGDRRVKAALAERKKQNPFPTLASDEISS